MFFNTMIDIIHQIKREYFNLAKITEEKHEATEDLDGILSEVKKFSDSTRFGHPLRRFINVIIKKCPTDFQNTLCQTENHEYNDANVPSERYCLYSAFPIIVAFFFELCHVSDNCAYFKNWPILKISLFQKLAYFKNWSILKISIF